MAAVATKSLWGAPEDAARVSKEINENIALSKKAFERRKKAIKILLLGQAESGKSTTLKNFQLALSPAHFHKERAAWKTITSPRTSPSLSFFVLPHPHSFPCRNVKRLLEVLHEEYESSLQDSSASSIAEGKGGAGRSPSSPGIRGDRQRE
ncbi:uncharacterized protein BXZ73DRAFT_99184 [Epithele typhae]|uniref:uncharacterized protein n=1 Tax=Epithele typhae TaxID=378194 RepID=UPI002007AB12|nr:uncharacterized protein BXZ73DRAFT_99184 [Epithele typhae]KAH9940188.1 hypothetical protein BXZ73DRAFT_99184 [Epithele typhae]